MTSETNISVSEPVVRETVLRFTATGGGLLIHRIAQIEKLAQSNSKAGNRSTVSSPERWHHCEMPVGMRGSAWTEAYPGHLG